MLKRFKKIKDVGRFCDVDISGRSFAATTIIFGNNGNGKSTLTAIIRSLASNNPKLIKERRTFGSIGDQKVEVVFGDDQTNNQIVFQNGRWENRESASRILIFDNKFIAQNIFDGERLVDSHRTNLHRVIVGELGRTLAQQVDSIRASIRQIDADLEVKRNQYRQSTVSRVLNIDQFVDLVLDPDASSKIIELRRQIEFSSVPAKPSIPEINFDFENAEQSLCTKPEAVHEEAKALVNNHIKTHWANEAGRKEFLQEGLSLLTETCPFCGQTLESVGQLIDAYREFFDSKYQKAESLIRQNLEAFRGWNLEALIGRVENLVREWRHYLPNECQPANDWFANQGVEALSQKAAFDEECRRKAGRIEYEVQFDELHGLRDKLKELSAVTAQLNLQIEEFKTKNDSANIGTLQRELSLAEANLLRQDDAWQEFCTVYSSKLTERNELSSAQTEKLRELEEYSNEAFSKHQAKINEVLETLGADFRIANLAEQRDLRRSEAVFCGFDLVFFAQYPVAIESGDDESPHFHNSLSQGDKNLLAFAFFVSSVAHDPEISRTVIVVDDPISSFDHERKQGTVSLLGRLADDQGQVPAQLIILTHEIGFLEKLVNHPMAANARYLKIVPDGLSVNGCKQSRVEDCNPWQEYLLPRELKYLDEIERTVQGNLPAPGDAHDKCRLILEGLMRNKYHLELKHLGRASSIGDYLQELENRGVYDSARVRQFDDIKGKLHEPHHSSRSDVAVDSQGDVTYILRETLRLIKTI